MINNCRYLINDKNASPEHVEKLSKFLELVSTKLILHQPQDVNNWL